MSDPSYPTGTITFLFTDIEGSTGLWEHHPEAMRSAVARHDALLRDAVDSNNGYLFKTTGDGIAAAFASASVAVDAALAAQTALKNEPWPSPATINTRIGLHTGVAELRAGDYFGPALSRCARLMAAGHGGQILLSEATHDLCHDALPHNATLVSLGTYRLKDLILPERIYQLRHPAITESFPPLYTLDDANFAHNLPNQITSFVGRDSTILEVRALLGRTQLLTLTGAGGSGKTRLSLQVAADVRDSFPDGVWQAEIASLSDPGLVVQTVSGVLGIREQAGQPMQATLIENVKNKRLLIVLDNAEHLLPACASLASSISRECRQIKMIVTSREPLSIAGELTYRVPPLSQPTQEQARDVTSESIRQFEATRLFIERAQYIRSDFAVSDANAPAVAAICRRLDGMPLAIELAAARVRSLGVDQINARLSDRFRLLTSGDRTALPRQQTLRALVDWSYDLLTSDERLLFERLSAFAGGWTIEAAEAVCGFEPLVDDQVLDLLTSLVDKSLVLADFDGDHVRYRLLETLRQYAAGKAAEHAEPTETGARHTEFFLALAEAAECHMAGKDESLWSNRLTIEHDNMRAALDRCAAVGGKAAISGLRLAGALWQYWYLRGYLSEGREHILRELSAWRGSGVDRMVLGESDIMIVARAAGAAGTFASSQGDHGAAETLLEESRSLYTEAGDTRGIANALNKLGVVSYSQGDYSTARTRYSESLRLYRAAGDDERCSGPLNNLGLVAYRQNDYATARSLYEESLTIYRRVGDKNRIASSLGNIGLVAQSEGDLPSASALLNESLLIYREIGAALSVSSTLLNLGTVALRAGDHEAAQLHYLESLNLSLENAYELGVARARSALGDLASARGDWPKARGFYRQSLMFYCEIGDKFAIAEGISAVASVCVGEGDMRRAMILWTVADLMRSRLGAPLSPADEATRNRDMEQVSAALGKGGFHAASEEGRVITPDQAIAMILTPST